MNTKSGPRASYADKITAPIRSAAELMEIIEEFGSSDNSNEEDITIAFSIESSNIIELVETLIEFNTRIEETIPSDWVADPRRVSIGGL